MRPRERALCNAFLYISLRAIRDASLSLARRASPSLFIDTDDATRRTAAGGEFRGRFSRRGGLRLKGHTKAGRAELGFSNLIHFPDSVRAARLSE